MERLTERIGRTVRVKGCRTHHIASELPKQYTRNAIVRLAAYEDSGLTPEEVAEFANVVRCQDCADADDALSEYSIYCNRHNCYMCIEAFCSYGKPKGE